VKSVRFALVYLSLLCVVLYLAQIDLLALPRVGSGSALVFAAAFVYLGFLANGLAWMLVLRGCGIPASYRDSLTSFGLTVFGKYIPGKIWALLGRAEIIAQAYDQPLRYVSVVSLAGQILALASGLMIGGVPLLIFLEYSVAQISIAALMLGSLIALMAPRIWLRALQRLRGRNPTPSLASAMHMRLAVAAYLLSWLFWCGGFWLLLKAVLPFPPPVLWATFFATAAIAGIAAVVVPGGLGVREGVLAGLLALSPSISLATATGVAVAGRLWFLFGEIALFLSALVASRAQAHRCPEERERR